LSARKSGNLSLKFGFNLVFATAFLQMLLGIITVVYASPWESAIVHQFGAILLWIFVLRARFLSKYPTRNVLSN
jgi:cytochrome c oxidase assembly protein subunit 15